MTLRQAQGAIRRAQGTVLAITAGLRQPSTSRLLTDRLVAAVRDHAPDADIEIVELREYAKALTNHLLTGFPDDQLSGLLTRLAQADGVIAVSPIFSGSYSGLFKTFFDVLEVEALAGTPVLIGATGGTARHSLALDHALRPLFSYLRAVVVPTGVHAAPEDWGSEAHLADRIDRAAAEFTALISPSRRPKSVAQTDGGLRDGLGSAGAEEGEVTPFETLLRGYGDRS